MYSLQIKTLNFIKKILELILKIALTVGKFKFVSTKGYYCSCGSKTLFHCKNEMYEKKCKPTRIY